MLRLSRFRFRSFVRIAFLEQRFGRASFNFENTEGYAPTKFLLSINKPEEALRRVWDGETVRCSANEFPTALASRIRFLILFRSHSNNSEAVFRRVRPNEEEVENTLPNSRKPASQPPRSGLSPLWCVSLPACLDPARKSRGMQKPNGVPSLAARLGWGGQRRCGNLRQIS